MGAVVKSIPDYIARDLPALRLITPKVHLRPPYTRSNIFNKHKSNSAHVSQTRFKSIYAEHGRADISKNRSRQRTSARATRMKQRVRCNNVNLKTLCIKP